MNEKEFAEHVRKAVKAHMEKEWAENPERTERVKAFVRKVDARAEEMRAAGASHEEIKAMYDNAVNTDEYKRLKDG
ncbi:hypothetical protein PBI_U2_66 [Mycobacterium phage U2]|uniref:Uncharacterized protein n=1 Tax=Mycobacterium phage U2 TaxID=260120 RepID=Q5J5N9_9CAUD|nr:hypothetical protein PBI_U2_66 [Mycobacterium phage U2]YP_009031258.1 hypothetical protein SEABISCUIT_72 [Mycobacterium phage Seabiscuit]AJA43555.1 hypothetical protein PBI_TREDDLE_74 [Mycobacterium phage Treddle]AVO22388.1 hypothetical protein PBI_SMEAGOL_75 [Mycobacterium phage Smeagol]QGJ90678.1 hypothetical protein SEA_BRITON15_75 [Mycobacterium phage Briton15]QJD53548.1 hypothetical protein SEA_MANATEE_70 [Mycobacterium phage Manatee]WAB09032.1 hypothetical protein PBI_MONET_76 [Mycob